MSIESHGSRKQCPWTVMFVISKARTYESLSLIYPLNFIKHAKKIIKINTIACCITDVINFYLLFFCN